MEKVKKGYKVIRSDMKHHGFTYKKGLNVDSNPFDYKGSCVPGGLYFFTELKGLPDWLGYGNHLWEVEVPEDSPCVPDPKGGKYRAHKLILKKRHSLSSKNIWKKIIKTCDKEKVLMGVAEYGHLEVVKLLLTAGADVHALNNYALRWAATNGHTEVVELLLAAGADVHALNNYALRWAATNGHTEVVELLLAAGADVHADNDQALRMAAANGHTEVVKLLLKAGANLHAGDNYALRFAAEYGHTEIVKLLLEAGADVHAQDNYALRFAAEYGYTEIVNLLKEYMKKGT